MKSTVTLYSTLPRSIADSLVSEISTPNSFLSFILTFFKRNPTSSSLYDKVLTAAHDGLNSYFEFAKAESKKWEDCQYVIDTYILKDAIKQKLLNFLDVRLAENTAEEIVSYISMSTSTNKYIVTFNYYIGVSRKGLVFLSK